MRVALATPEIIWCANTLQKYSTYVRQPCIILFTFLFDGSNQRISGARQCEILCVNNTVIMPTNCIFFFFFLHIKNYTHARGLRLYLTNVTYMKSVLVKIMHRNILLKHIRISLHFLLASSYVLKHLIQISIISYFFQELQLYNTKYVYSFQTFDKSFPTVHLTFSIHPFLFFFFLFPYYSFSPSS